MTISYLTRGLFGKILMVGLAALLWLGHGDQAQANDPAKTFEEKQKAEKIVFEAAQTITDLWNDKEVGPRLREYYGRAKAVVIVPKSWSGSFMVGAEGGNGLIIARTQDGGWGYPAFVTVGAASFGFQIGARQSESVFLVMTNKGLKEILDRQVKIGGEINGAIGTEGVGMKAGSTTDVNLDVLSFSNSAGLFVGAALEGTVIKPDPQRNEAYYGLFASQRDIVLYGANTNPQADSLRITLDQLAK